MTRFRSALSGALRDIPGLLFETPADALGRVNLWCSRIVLAGVGGIFAIVIVTEVF